MKNKEEKITIIEPDYYRQMFEIGKLPNKGTIKITKKIKNFKILKNFEIIGSNGNIFICIPNTSQFMDNKINYDSCYAYFKDDKITFVITTKEDRSMYDGLLLVEYYKKDLFKEEI